MILKKKQKTGPIEIDITGPQGNAFQLINYAKTLRNRFNLDVSFMQIQDEMMAGDYENLLQVFDKYFGEYVILYR